MLSTPAHVTDLQESPSSSAVELLTNCEMLGSFMLSVELPVAGGADVAVLEVVS